MVAIGVLFQKSDETVFGIIRTRMNDNLDIYDDQTYGIIEIDSTHNILQQQSAWRVTNNTLVPKKPITLTADVLTFSADGATECTITATGLTDECLIRVNGRPTVLTLADPVLILTSTDPLLITIIIDDPLHWGEDLIVEAV